MDARLTYPKWQRWIEVIADDVDALHQSRETFRVVQGEYEKKYPVSGPRWALRDSVLYNWIGDLFVARAAIAVRRQADPNPGNSAISLGRLLTELAKNPEVLTRDRYRALFDETVLPRSLVDQWFDEFAGAGATSLPANVVVADLDRLNAASQAVRAYADKRVAHWDSQPPKTQATWRDLHSAIDTLWELTAKYQKLLKALVMEPKAYPLDWFDR